MGESKEDKLLFMCVSMLWFMIRSQGYFLFCLVIWARALFVTLYSLYYQTSPILWMHFITLIYLFSEFLFLWFSCSYNACNLVCALLLIAIARLFFFTWNSSSKLEKKGKKMKNEKTGKEREESYFTDFVIKTCYILFVASKKFILFSMLMALCLSMELRILNRLWVFGASCQKYLISRFFCFLFYLEFLWK